MCLTHATHMSRHCNFWLLCFLGELIAILWSHIDDAISSIINNNNSTHSNI